MVRRQRNRVVRGWLTKAAVLVSENPRALNRSKGTEDIKDSSWGGRARNAPNPQSPCGCALKLSIHSSGTAIDTISILRVFASGGRSIVEVSVVGVR